MSAWTITCLVLGIPFLLVAFLFLLLKEKVAILISGFNTLPKKEQEQYDKTRMSSDMRNLFFVWSGICFLGAGLSRLFNDYFAMASLLIWLVLFMKEVHVDNEKAFGKYRNK